MGSAFGAEAGASPVGNKTEALAGTTGTGKGGGSGAWELPVGAAEDGRSGPSEGLQPAVPSLGLKKSRSDCSFCEEMESVSEQRKGTEGCSPLPLAPLLGALLPPHWTGS